MDYKDILAMASAYKEVAEASAKTRALQSIKAQPKDKVSLAKAPWEKEKEVKKEAMDPVDAKALKGKHKDRKDKDIDNDGDVDSSDEYLHKRRKAVSKAMKGKEIEVEVQANESVELDENKTAQMLHRHMLKALGKSKLPKNHTYRSAVADNGDFVVHDGSGRTAGRLKKGEHDVPSKMSEGDESGMTSAQKKKFDGLYNKMNNGKEHKAIRAKIMNPVKADDAFHAMVKKMAMESVDEAAQPKWKVPVGNTHYTVTARNTAEASRKAQALAKKAGNNGVGGKIEKVSEAKDHGNMDNASPRGEGLSPSAKKELDRTTPMNPATDEEKVNNLNFKTFKAMAKKAPMRSGDNAAGDKTMPSVKEEAENLDEISQDMQNRYLKKASKQSQQSDKAAYTSVQKSTQDKHKARIGRRSKGIGSVYKRDQAKADPDFIHKPSATDRIKSGQGTMTNKPASALNKAYKDRK